MRKNNILILIIILLYATSSYCQSDLKNLQTKISEDLYDTKILDCVYMFTHYFPGGCNGMFILLPYKQGLLTDTSCESTGVNCFGRRVICGKLEKKVSLT